MNKFLKKQVEEMMPVFAGNPPAFGDFDMEGQVQFIDDFMKAGAAEFKLLYFACVFGFKTLASILTLKPWSKLDIAQKQAIANKLFVNKNPLVRSIAVLSGLPLYISYYRREDVQVPLGFDAKALKADANLRSVSRDRSLPPK